MKRLETLKQKHSEKISDIRGKGLLIAIEFFEEKKAMEIYNDCIKNHLFVNITQGKIVRLFPALNITEAEMAEGLAIFEKVISASV